VGGVVAGLVSTSEGASFSFVGEELKSIEVSGFASGSDDREVLSSLWNLGESSFNASVRCTLRRLERERGEGVFAGDDFWGEMDRARSAMSDGG
jgi:hypothetical protein